MWLWKTASATSEQTDWDTTSHFVNSRGQKIFCKYWDDSDANNIKAAVYVSHGVGEHSGWYAKLAEPMKEQGFLLFAHDHVGHGLSEGDRVDITDFDLYVDDIKQHIDLMKEKHPNLSFFILGHSMGGAIATKTCLRYPDLFAGMILNAPSMVPNPETVTAVKLMLAKTLAWVAPQMTIGKIQSDWVSRDASVRERYDTDPLVWHGGLKARWAVCILATLTYLQENMAKVTTPFLVQHGTEDKLCHITGSEMLNQLATAKDKTIKIYPGGYHKLLDEPDGMGSQVIQDTMDWLCARV